MLDETHVGRGEGERGLGVSGQSIIILNIVVRVMDSFLSIDRQDLPKKWQLNRWPGVAFVTLLQGRRHVRIAYCFGLRACVKRYWPIKSKKHLLFTRVRESKILWSCCFQQVCRLMLVSQRLVLGVARCGRRLRLHTLRPLGPIRPLQTRPHGILLQRERGVQVVPT